MSEKQHNELLEKMDATRKKWMEEEEDPDDGDRLLQEAIDMAIRNGKGWAPGEKEAYMKKILDDDYIPPMFCSTQEELDRTGLADAFSALQFDDDPALCSSGFCLLNNVAIGAAYARHHYGRTRAYGDGGTVTLARVAMIQVVLAPLALHNDILPGL